MKLPIKPLPANDNGRLLTRLNYKHRNGIPRFGILQIENVENGKNVKTLVLGHNDESAIFMPYDVRVALGVSTGEELEFGIRKVGRIGKLVWLLGSPDPAVHVPAWLAAISLALGALGLLLSLI